MIGYLQGMVRGKVILTEAGVGYTVQTTRPLPQGHNVELYVTTIVREDAITLYGFSELSEQLLFEALCRLNGVGASSALAVLRDAGVAAVVAAVTKRDPSLLGKIKGVGPKTAARIVSDLSIPDGVTVPAGAANVDDELVAGLVGLGFDRSAAIDALAAAGDGDEETLMFEALARLQAGVR